MLDIEFPPQKLVHLNLLFKGLSRKKPHLPHKALPMTPQILLEMYSYMDMSSPVEATFWCAFLFMFFLMATKSNIVPVSYADFDVWPTLFLLNVSSALKGTHNYIFI